MTDTGLDGEYDNENIFAKILRGEFPCHKVFEDDSVLAFMDVFPQAPGHVLIVPKVAARNLLDFPTELFGDYMARVQKIAQAMKAALSPEGISMFQFSGAAGGQSVFHLHFHLVPRANGQLLKGHGNIERADDAELRGFANAIAQALTEQ